MERHFRFTVHIFQFLIRGFTRRFIRTALMPAVFFAFMLGGCAVPGSELPPSTALSSGGVTVISSGYENITPTYVFTYADNQPEDYPTTQGAYYFAELVNERSRGDIQICIYADAILGGEGDVVSQLRFGGVDFVRASLAQVTEYNKEAQVLMLPYLYDDSEHMWAVLDGEIGQEIMDSFEGSGLMPLSWYDAGVRDFYMKEPVTCLEDIQGRVIRVQESTLMEDMVRSLGAEPVATEYSDVYSAIQTGRVDGAENNWPSYVSMGHNEVAQYYITDEHMRIPELQLMSRVTFDKLTTSQRELIAECAKESAFYERKLWVEYEQSAKEKALREGTQIIELSVEEKARFREVVEPLYEKYCGDQMDRIEQIRAAGQR